MSNVEVGRLLSEAAEWRLLGLLFEYPTAKWREQVAALIPDLGRPELQAVAQDALEYSGEGLHIALFGPAGSVPAREAAYSGGVQLGYLMSELAAYYDAFGYRPATEEADDHLSVEAGFVAYLKLKQAAAVASGQVERAAVTEVAAAQFLTDHIAVMAEPVAKKLEVYGPDYLIAGAKAVAGHSGPPARSGYPLGGEVLDDGLDEMTCGSPVAGEDLIQLKG